MYEEVDTGTNLPANRSDGDGGHGVSVFVRHQRRRLGEQDDCLSGNQSAAESGEFGKIPYGKNEDLGYGRLPAVSLVFVIGGTSAEACLKTVKLASTGYLDHLPTTGNAQAALSRC